MNLLEPLRSIVPILKGHKGQALTDLLGTGFFLGTPSALHLVTAKHVFQGNPVEKWEHYAFAFRTERGIEIRELKKVLVSVDFDVAACPISELGQAISLQFSREEPALNDDIFTFEYSSTRFERKPTGGTHVAFEPMSHKGNVVRYYDSTFPESVLTPSFLTSFAALQGASGAPVMFSTSEKNICVTGILVANQEQHLLPAQVVRIEEESGSVEETKYFLPLGKALHAKVIVPFLKEVGVEDILIGHTNDA